MLPNKTVFIVGAGASAEAGLPVGRRLRQLIHDSLNFTTDDFGKITDGDPRIVSVLQRTGRLIGSFGEACRRIHGGILYSPSVDDFVNTHRDDEALTACAKVAITACILAAEHHSTMWYERRNIADTISPNRLRDTWYPSFYELISGGIQRTKIETLFENVTIISFNYDRCVEHYLVHAIASHLFLSLEEASDFVASKLSIFHPYGYVGPYFGKTNEVVPFGGHVPSFDKIQASIRTYAEQVDDHSDLALIRNAIFEARMLVFLGNAFHPINMNLLTPEQSSQERKKVYFTSLGLSPASLPIVHQKLALLDGTNVGAGSAMEKEFFLHTATCAKLFEEFGMLLST